MNSVFTNLILAEGKIFEKSTKKTKLKRKYLGTMRGRTATGKPAHAIDIDPEINFKKTNTTK